MVKKELPHSHILIWRKLKIIRRADVDKIISAELLDKVDDPEFFETIKTQLIHGLCGDINPDSHCMQDKKCSKRYPKAYLQENQTEIDGYPHYRRKIEEWSAIN